MRIRSVRVENFRSISAGVISFTENTTIIGQNNSGKSAILTAVEFFFRGSSDVSVTDFHHRDIKSPILITIHFGDLTPVEREKFETNLIDGELVITREFTHEGGKESGRFFVEAFVNPAFSEVRAEAGKAKKTDLYNAIREAFGLPKVKAADDIDAHLEAWEDKNPGALKRTRVAGFRGFKGVAVGTLREKTEFILVPAIKDISRELDDPRSSPVRSLIATLARQTIENKKEFQEFRQQANAKLAELTSPEGTPALQDFSTRLTQTLQQYYKDSDLIATWNPITELPITFPTAEVQVRDNDFLANIENVGHGLQRAVLFTVLEFIARQKMEASSEAEFEEAQSDIILAIEEPEIYQHPTKQRLFSQALKDLCRGFSKQNGIRIQIISVTHSNMFVDIHNLDDIRLCRRPQTAAGSAIAISNTSIEKCAKIIADIKGVEANATRYGIGLHTFSHEISEGFFARKIVLVEGPSDRAVLGAVFKLRERNPLAEGVVILSSEGKTKLDKPALIFSQLGIPTFVVVDNDVDGTKQKVAQAESYNRLLQRIIGVPDAQVTAFPIGCFQKFAAFKGNLEAYLEEQAGTELYLELRKQVAELLEIGEGDCLKSPAATSALLFQLSARKVQLPLLDQIIEALDALD